MGKLEQNDHPITTHNSSEEDTCCCTPVDKCEDCALDVRKLQSGETLGYNQTYICPTHGPYRAYQDYLVQTKDWCILFVTISLVPFGLLIFGTGIDLNWMFYCGAILTIPCFIPVILAIVWAKATCAGLISGEFLSTINYRCLLTGLAMFFIIVIIHCSCIHCCPN